MMVSSSLIAVLLLTAATTQTIPSTEILAKVEARLLEIEGVSEVSLGLGDEGIMTWQLQSSSRQPNARYHAACQAIQNFGAMGPNVDVAFVSNIEGLRTAKDPEVYIYGRFNCATWQFFSH